MTRSSRVSFVRFASLVAFLVLALFFEPALADFAAEVEKGLVGIAGIYTESRRAIVAITVLAILGMGVAAYFGRFPWKWFWTLSGGLFLISVGGIALNEFLSTAVSQTSMTESLF